MKTPTTTTPVNKCDKCDRAFPSKQGLMVHQLRKHSGRNWDTSKNFHRKRKKRYPSDTAEYRRAQYHRKKAQSKIASNASLAMKASWARRKAAKNGVLLPHPVETDPIGEAARAIMIAAKVLRGTLHSLRLP